MDILCFSALHFIYIGKTGKVSLHRFDYLFSNERELSFSSFARVIVNYREIVSNSQLITAFLSFPL